MYISRVGLGANLIDVADICMYLPIYACKVTSVACPHCEKMRVSKLASW